MRVAALFDIDGTLLARNSALLFARLLHREGVLTRTDVAVVAYHLLRYYFGVVDPGDLLGRAMHFVRGRPEQWMIDLCDRWYEQEVRAHVRPRMREIVEEHRAQGHVLALLSSSTGYLGDPLGRDLAIEHRLVNRLTLDPDRRFTGWLEQPFCYGPGKIEHARRFAASHGVDLAESYFYTDSITDLAPLLAVGHPRVVRPDPRLRREAIRRGWPILDA